MKSTCNIAPWLTVIGVLLMLVSCDPVSSVDYKIHNMTGDTVVVTMYKEILTSAYLGYEIEENDSLTTHYGVEDSTHVAVLEPRQTMAVHNDWKGLYREERVIPIWKYIKSITMGHVEMGADKWNDESAWHLKTQGGGFGEGESRYYDLYIR